MDSKDKELIVKVYGVPIAKVDVDSKTISRVEAAIGVLILVAAVIFSLSAL